MSCISQKSEGMAHKPDTSLCEYEKQVEHDGEEVNPLLAVVCRCAVSVVMVMMSHQQNFLQIYEKNPRIIMFFCIFFLNFADNYGKFFANNK